MQKIEQLVGDLDHIGDPHVRSQAVELVQLLMELHGIGLERLFNILRNAGAAGNDLMNRVARDDVVASLLLLYGLHPLDLETRVRQALDKVRPYLQSHGGNVELLGIDDGRVRLRLQGSCHGCPSSAMTLKLAIEEAIYEIAPDIGDLTVEGVVEQRAPAEFVAIESLNNCGNGNVDHGAWQKVAP